MRISDWSSDVCSSDLEILNAKLEEAEKKGSALTATEERQIETGIRGNDLLSRKAQLLEQIRAPLEEYRNTIEALNGLLAEGEINQTSYNARLAEMAATAAGTTAGLPGVDPGTGMAYADIRSEEHTSELQSLMRISSAVFCLKKKKTKR